MKKIILVLENSTEIVVGSANSIYEWLLEITDKQIVPFHGHQDYDVVRNVYYEPYNQFVTFRSE